MKGRCSFLVLFVLITSCAPFSSSLMRAADQSITLPEVRQEPARFLGSTVLWGGIIVDTINRPGETLITISQTELDIQKKPTHPDKSSGRFMVRTDQFLDPAIYDSGREVTVIGKVAGTQKLPLGQSTYTYVVVAADEIHLWEKPMPQIYMGEPWPWYGYPYLLHQGHPFWW
ncbi:MAG: Slp family lipoprotein [Smithellaceae bacterium]|nr:Slp family lipoprotein [Smithellaceae bacterium]